MSRRSITLALAAAGVHILLAMCTHTAAADEPPKPQVWKAAASADRAPDPKKNEGAPDATKDSAPSQKQPAETSADTKGTPANAAGDASEKADARADEKTIDVRVIGSSADALQKIPGSGQLIGTKDIARAQPVDMAELLRRVPGLVVRQEQGGGLRLDISVRGLDNTRSRRVLVLEDGVPVANNPYGEPDLYYSTPFERVRGVEVVKGSGSILFGPQTIGGVVQFLTFAPPESRSVAMWMNAGAPGQFELLGRYGDRYHDVRYVAQISGKRGDGARGESYWATDAFAKLAVPVSETSELFAKVGYHEEAATSTDVGLTSAMFEADPRRPTLAPYDEVRVRRVDGSLTHKLYFGESAELLTLAYVTSTSRVWRRQDYDRGPAPPPGSSANCGGPLQGVDYERIVGDLSVPCGAIYFRDTNTIRDRSYTVLGIEPRLSYRFTTGAVGHTLQAGGRFLVESAARAQRAGETPLSEAGSSISVEDSNTTAFAAYVQDRLAFSERLLVTPGFRFEYASSKRSIRRTTVEGQVRDVTAEGTSSFVAPLPGIGIVAGWPELHGFGGMHFGFAPPRLTTAIRADGVDEQLDAERAVHYEVGLRSTVKRALRGEATFFLSNFENQIVPASRAGSATTDLVNAGRTQHIGLETALRFDANKAFMLPLSVDVYAAYTYLSARYVHGPNDGVLLPYAPEHSASMVLDVEHPNGVGGQASWTYVGPQLSGDPVPEDEPADPTGRTGSIPGYNLLDFSVRYTHKPTGLGGTLAVKNALDEIYIASRRPDGIFPGGFRQIVATVRWSYGEGAR